MLFIFSPLDSFEFDLLAQLHDKFFFLIINNSTIYFSVILIFLLALILIGVESKEKNFFKKILNVVYNIFLQIFKTQVLSIRSVQ